MNVHDELGRWIDAHHDEQIAFLREIVRVPSDTPPGNNAPAAQRAAELLAALDFTVERHPVAAEFLREYGMQSVTNLIVRHQPAIASNVGGKDCGQLAFNRLDRHAWLLPARVYQYAQPPRDLSGGNRYRSFEKGHGPSVVTIEGNEGPKWVERGPPSRVPSV